MGGEEAVQVMVTSREREREQGVETQAHATADTSEGFQDAAGVEKGSPTMRSTHRRGAQEGHQDAHGASLVAAVRGGTVADVLRAAVREFTVLHPQGE